MNEKKLRKLWAASLIVCSLSNLILAILDEMPDALLVALCVVILAAVIALVYTSLKLWQNKL